MSKTGKSVEMERKLMVPKVGRVEQEGMATTGDLVSIWSDKSIVK
jgi:hypothetical protein